MGGDLDLLGLVKDEADPVDQEEGDGDRTYVVAGEERGSA
jgi:hypothetical protein